MLRLQSAININCVCELGQLSVQRWCSGAAARDVRGRVRTARCRSLVLGEALPFDDASVCGLDETEYECDFRPGKASGWPSWDLSGVADEAAERPEGGRGEAADEEAVGGRGRADGSKRPPGLGGPWSWLWSAMDMDGLAMPPANRDGAQEGGGGVWSDSSESASR